MRMLKERLEDGGMAVEIEPDGQALEATKLGDLRSRRERALASWLSHR